MIYRKWKYFLKIMNFLKYNNDEIGGLRVFIIFDIV